MNVSAWWRDGGIETLRKDFSPVKFQYDADLADPAATVPADLRDQITWESQSPCGEDPLARRLNDHAPGPGLAALLAGLDPERISQPALLAAAAAAERQERWSHSVSLRLIAEADRRSYLGQVGCHELANELSLRLSISPSAADHRIADAATICGSYPATLAALTAGAIDRGKARIIVDSLLLAEKDLSPERLHAAEANLVEHAGRKTHGQLRAHAKKVIARMIPLKVQERKHEQARKERCVTLDPGHDGMAWLTAWLPAPEAMAAYTVIDRMAGKQGADDGRSRDQRRADAFSRLFRGILDSGQTPSGPLPTSQRGRPHLLITVSQPPKAGPGDWPRAPRRAPDDGGTGGVDAAPPRGGAPAGPAQEPPHEPPHERAKERAQTPILTLEGYGAITPSLALGAVGGARVTLSLTDPASGPHRQLVALPGADARQMLQAALAGTLAIPGTWPGVVGHASSPGRQAGPAPPDEQISGHGRESPGLGAGPDPGSRSAPGRALEPVTALDAPLGGAIDWKAARIASEWPVSSTGYRPGVHLLRLVLLRDMRCTFPTCQLPAWRCDIDHIVPFDASRPAEDQTTAINLHAACRAHHRLKTLFGWRVEREAATGIITWITPGGERWDTWPECLDDVS